MRGSSIFTDDVARSCCQAGRKGSASCSWRRCRFGAPVIAAREKGAVDVVQHGSTGLLVGYGDVVAIKDAMERLLGDASLRERLRERARLTVAGRGEFTFNAFTERWARLLAVTAESPQSPGASDQSPLSPNCRVR